MGSGGIFISYRRDDSRASAGRLYETLRADFGADRLFKDVDNIAPGRDFREEIGRAIDESSIMLAVIGPTWASDRLHRSTDLVRIEVARGLESDLVVIPVLVDGATLPEPELLPTDVQDLVYRNAVSLDHDTWGRDVASLLAGVRSVLDPAGAAPNTSDAGSPSWSVEIDVTSASGFTARLVRTGERHQLELRQLSGWAGLFGLGTRWTVVVDGQMLHEETIYSGTRELPFRVSSAGGSTEGLIVLHVPAAVGATTGVVHLDGEQVGSFALR